MPDLQVPIKEYYRPDGRSETKEITIPNGWTEQRAAVLNTLKQEDIVITAEQFQTVVNVCLYNGDFDYRFEVEPSDMLYATILRLLDEFDLEHYRRAVAAMAEWA